jgi:DNA-binding SARP family transcriptional activator
VQVRFVGRRHELARLTGLLPHDPASTPTLALISGEAGVGKTRLVTEFAEHAASLGFSVLWGRSTPATVDTPYWPWVQVVRTILDEPRLTDLGPGLLDSPTAKDPVELYDALGQLLADHAEPSGAVVILDDLHVTDESSLRVLAYLARMLVDTRVLVVAASRIAGDAGGLFPHELALGPLSAAEVGELVGDSSLDGGRVFAATGGNPFFVEQVLHGTLLDGALDDASESLLATVVGKRLETLPPATRDALVALAVLGASPADRLARLNDADPDAVSDALGLASAAGIVDLGTEAGGDIRFTHDLHAEVVRGTLAPERLRTLHARAAELWEGTPNGLPRVAHHFIAAGQGYREQAVAACRTAARSASDRLGHDDAAVLYRLALETLGVDSPAPEALAIRMELARSLWRSGRHEEAGRWNDEAWEAARAIGDAAALADAALGTRLALDFSGAALQETAARCAEALAALGSQHPALRVRVLATSALALLTIDPETARAHGDEAHQLAAAIDDDVALGYALVARCATDLSPDTLHDRVRDARRVLRIAAATGEWALVSPARFILLGSLVEQGNIRLLDAELGNPGYRHPVLDELRDGRHDAWFLCLRAILDGDAERAERAVHEALARATESRDPDAAAAWGGQFALVRWMQDRVEELEPLFVGAVRENPGDPIWPVSLAWLRARLGEHDAARGLVESVLPLTRIPRDRNWLACMAILAEPASIVAEEALQRRLYDVLAPYAGRLVPIGLGVACWGTVDRALALLARALGDDAGAIGHYRSAIAVCGYTGARAWLAEAQVELAELLLATGGDTEEAARLLTEARGAAERMRWPRTERLAREALDEWSRATTVDPLHLVPDVAAEVRIVPLVRVLGQFAVVHPDGSVARWSSRKARRVLKILVARRGRTIGREELLALVWPGEPVDSLANRLSVALATVRRMLDPGRVHDLQHFVTFDEGGIRLNPSSVMVDAEELIDASVTGIADRSIETLTDAVSLYQGEAFTDEIGEEWSEALREQAHAAFVDAAFHLAVMSPPRQASELYRTVLLFDEYNEAAAIALRETLADQGASALARAWSNPEADAS